jgi:hypothetical protein
MNAIREAATRAVWAGGLSCVATGLAASLGSDLALDAFRMTLGLTIVVPPTILLVGWLLTRSSQ